MPCWRRPSAGSRPSATGSSRGNRWPMTGRSRTISAPTRRWGTAASPTSTRHTGPSWAGSAGRATSARPCWCDWPGSRRCRGVAGALQAGRRLAWGAVQGAAARAGGVRRNADRGARRQAVLGLAVALGAAVAAGRGAEALGQHQWCADNDRDWANRTVLDSDLAKYRQYFIDHGVNPPTSVDGFDRLTVEERQRLGLDSHGYYIDLDTAADELMERFKGALKPRPLSTSGTAPRRPSWSPTMAPSITGRGARRSPSATRTPRRISPSASPGSSRG